MWQNTGFHQIWENNKNHHLWDLEGMVRLQPTLLEEAVLPISPLSIYHHLLDYPCKPAPPSQHVKSEKGLSSNIASACPYGMYDIIVWQVINQNFHINAFMLLILTYDLYAKFNARVHVCVVMWLNSAISLVGQILYLGDNYVIHSLSLVTHLGEAGLLDYLQTHIFILHTAIIHNIQPEYQG